MYKMLDFEKGTFRCLRNCSSLVPPGTRAFAGPAVIDMDDEVIYSKPEWDGINFCPSFFQDAMHFNRPPKEAYNERSWYDKFEHKRRPTQENWAIYENFNPVRLCYDTLVPAMEDCCCLQPRALRYSQS